MVKRGIIWQVRSMSEPKWLQRSVENFVEKIIIDTLVVQWTWHTAHTKKSSRLAISLIFHSNHFKTSKLKQKLQSETNFCNGRRDNQTYPDMSRASQNQEHHWSKTLFHGSKKYDEKKTHGKLFSLTTLFLKCRHHIFYWVQLKGGTKNAWHVR